MLALLIVVIMVVAGLAVWLRGDLARRVEKRIESSSGPGRSRPEPGAGLEPWQAWCLVLAVVGYVAAVFGAAEVWFEDVDPYAVRLVAVLVPAVLVLPVVIWRSRRKALRGGQPTTSRGTQ